MKTIFLFVAFALNFKASTVNPARENFSGTWQINIQKSDFSGADPSTTCKKLTIIQRDDSITDSRTIEISGQDVVTSETVAYNGQPVVLPVTNGEKRVWVKWSDDGQMLTRIADYDLNSNGMKDKFTATETWKIMEGGKTLTVNLTIEESTGRKYSIVAVYDKI